MHAPAIKKKNFWIRGQLELLKEQATVVVISTAFYALIHGIWTDPLTTIFQKEMKFARRSFSIVYTVDDSSIIM